MSLYKATGGLDEAQNRSNLQTDLEKLEKSSGTLGASFYQKALTTGETSNVTSRTNYYTAGGTIAAQGFALPAAPADGDEVTILTQAATTSATWSVQSPGAAAIIGGPSATVALVPITFKFNKSGNKWYRIS